MLTIFLFGIGAIYGSFLNMLLWRLPREEGIGGRSKCPSCHRQLAWYDLVPIFSFLGLSGKCRSCHARISIRYLLVEVSSAVVLGLFSLFTAPTLTTMPMIAGIYTLIIFISLFFFDLYYYILPDTILIPAILIIGLYTIFFESQPIQYLITALISGLFFAILYTVSKGRWLGFGDVKLAILLGLVFGYPLGYLVIVGSVWLGALTGMVMIASGKATMKKALPFGAFLSSVAIFALLFHYKLIYLETFFR